jgi:hypothetical protein
LGLFFSRSNSAVISAGHGALVAATGFYSSMLRDMTILLYAVHDDTATLVRAEL